MGHSRRTWIQGSIALFFTLLFCLVQNGDGPARLIDHHYYYYHHNRGQFLPDLEVFLAEEASVWTLPYRNAENAAHDLLQIKGRRAPLHPQLVFLGIDAATVDLSAVDDATIAASPALSLMRSQWPFPRSTYALVCDRLIGAGARAVAFDLMFPSRAKDPATDLAWKAAIDRYPEEVVIAMNFSENNSPNGSGQMLSLPADTLFLARDHFDPRLGYVNFLQEEDDVIRRVNYRNNEQNANRLPGAERSPLLYSLSARAVQKGGYADKVPNDLQSRFFRYLDADDTASVTFPLYALFEPHFWAETFQNGAYFKNKIVIIGPQGDWAKDEFATPVGTLNGVEIHFAAMNALLQHEFLFPVSGGTTLSLLAAAGGLAWLLATGVPHMGWRFGSVLLLQAAYVYLAQLLFNGLGLLLPIMGPLLTLNGSALIGLVYDYLVQQMEKSRIRSTFEKYVSRNVVREILDRPDAFQNSLGGVRKPVTILFSDLRGFTSLTEHSDSHALVTQLNEYFTAMVEAVFQEEGTLDKFIGDAVMAVWGNTVSHGPAADAVQAVRCSLAMSRALRVLNARWKEEGRPEWQIGIGLNHGTVIVGNMGAPQRKEFSVIGDAVNLASRFEGQTKPCQVEILLGESVADLVRDTFYLQSLELVQVAGRQAPVLTYTVWQEKGEPLPPELERFLTSYEAGVLAFRAREFARAAGLFQEAAELKPGHYLTGEYLRESLHYTTHPPGPDWTGVRVSKTK